MRYIFEESADLLCIRFDNSFFQKVIQNELKICNNFTSSSIQKQVQNQYIDGV